MHEREFNAVGNALYTLDEIDVPDVHLPSPTGPSPFINGDVPVGNGWFINDKMGPREMRDIDIMQALNTSDSYENLIKRMEEIISANNISDDIDDPNFFWTEKLSSGVNVIINGGYRTGSSLAGEFINRHSSFAYYFEPLHDLEGTNQTIPVSTLLLSYVLRKLLQCNIQGHLITGTRRGSPWKDVVLCGLGKSIHRYNIQTL